MVRRWGSSIGAFAAAVAFGVAELIAGNPVAAGGLFVLFLILAVLVSPSAFPRSITDVEARELSARDGRPIVYWRPGCPFCMRLRATIGRRADRVHWVDIWADPQGAASVRAVAGGNETVPTVIAAGEAMVNPSPERIRELVRG